MRMMDPLVEATRSMPEDLPPGPMSRAARTLGLTDDTPPLVRGTRAWWLRAAVLAAGLLVMVALVALGG
jgi:hypothetical protein